jgi:hypothetical protein
LFKVKNFNTKASFLPAGDVDLLCGLARMWHTSNGKPQKLFCEAHFYAPFIDFGL